MKVHERAAFFRRTALAVSVVLVLAIGGVFSLAWLIGAQFGLTGWSAAVPGLALIAILIGLASVGFGGMRRFSVPLGEVMNAADRVAEGDYTVRVRESGPPPMRALTHSFNAMTGRLQNADRVRRDLMADVAHELRTPLAILQGRVEGLIDGVYPRDEAHLVQLLDQTHVLSTLIEDLRTLALSDAGSLPLHREPTDIGELIRDAVRGLQPEAGRRSVTLSAAAFDEPAIVLEIDPVRIREVLTNLLVNALRYTSNGQSISVSMNAGKQDVAVAVADTGAGIPSEEVGRIFDRFYKGSQSRGSGLGLAIAKSIVHAHGGDIRATSSPGNGTAVTFTLPRLQ